MRQVALYASLPLYNTYNRVLRQRTSNPMPREKMNPRYATVVYCFALIVRCFPRKETLSSAFHDQNSSFLAAVALTVSFLGKFLESMESFPTHTNVYSFMKFSINFRQKILVGVSRWENYFVKLLCVYFFKETKYILCFVCAGYLFSLYLQYV